MHNYYYKVYETIMRSDFPILNMPLVETGDYEISVDIINTPSAHLPAGYLGTYYSGTVCAMGCSWGTIEVSDGTTMKIHLYDGFTYHDACPYIIGWGMGFLFNQRGYSIFHCSALNIDNKGLIVSGVSGAGKSTIALSLIKSGAKYLADDMAIINPENSYDIIPAYPLQKVCRDVSCDLDSNSLVPISEGRGKFAYYNENEFCDKPTPLTHLVLLNIWDGEELLIKEHHGIDKWMKVLECLYLNELYASFDTPDKDKRNCLKMASQIRVIEISRPKDKDTVNEITNYINEFIKE